MRGTGLIRGAYRALRRRLRGAGTLRSAWYLGIAVSGLLRDPWRHPASFEQEFAREEDPWGYGRADERRRHRAALDLLEQARGPSRWRRGLEVGCAEGVFTELLAPACEELSAVDFAPLALERTALRCRAHPHVHTAAWDLRREPVPGTFELIVAMDVLSSIFRPREMRRVRDALADALESGGVLLVGDVRMNEVWEESWWSRHFVRGGKWITHFVGDHPQLVQERQVWLDSHVLSLFRKVDTPQGHAS